MPAAAGLFLQNTHPSERHVLRKGGDLFGAFFHSRIEPALNKPHVLSFPAFPWMFIDKFIGILKISAQYYTRGSMFAY